MAEKIKFIEVVRTDAAYRPVPASKLVPDWYKDMDSYVGKRKIPTEDAKSQGTMKKCMPLFDSITSGYLILLPCDIYVSQKDGFPYFQWASHPVELISFHPLEQVHTYPKIAHYRVPKFNNIWGIKTSPGYSCLFTTPIHRDLPFSIFTGVVDTDQYHIPVTFPFLLNDPNYEGYIYAGTPIAQVIPFKRTSWVLEIEEASEKTLLENNKQTLSLQSSWYESYKSKWWHKKEYK